MIVNFNHTNTTTGPSIKTQQYAAGLYIIIVVIFYCIGGAILICTGMKRRHKHQLTEEEQVQSYLGQRRFIEKQAKVDQIWHTDRFLRRIFVEHKDDAKEDANPKIDLDSIKELISKSPKNVFSIPHGRKSIISFR